MRPSRTSRGCSSTSSGSSIVQTRSRGSSSRRRTWASSPNWRGNLPGARFVVLHRDPVDVIPSVVAIVRELRRLYCTGPGDLQTIGDWAVAEYAGAMERHMAWRQTAPAGSVLDVAYADVVADEEAVIERVYAHCGLTLADEARERMERWSADNTQHKHGEHVYSLAEGGLTRSRIETAFAGYLREFGRYFGQS